MDNQTRKAIEQKFWNEFAVKYDRAIERHARPGYEKLLAMIVEDGGGGQNLLEIATGTGLLAINLRDHIARITATDLSPDMIGIARKKAAEQAVDNVVFQVEDACALSFPNNSFDIVLASNVLHLLFDPQLALTEMKRVLRPDGKIIVPTYCHGQNLFSRALSLTMGLRGFTARSRWSIETFGEFLESNGFSPIKTTRIKGAIPLAYVVAKPKHDGHDSC